MRWSDSLAWLRRHRMFVLIALTYAYFFQGGDPNQTSRLLLTRALVERRAPDITPDHPLTIDKSEWRGKFYSDKAPGVSLLAALPYAAIRVVERASGVEPAARSTERARLHALVFVLSGLAGVLAAYSLRRCLASLGASERASGVLTLGYAFGTLAFPFSTVLFGHQTAAALLCTSFALCLRERELTQEESRRSTRLALGALWALAVVVEYPTALLVAPLGLHFLAGEPSARARVVAFAWVVAGAVPVLFVHSAFLLWAFGSPWDLPYNHVVNPIFRAHTTAGFLGIGLPRLSVLRELLLGRYRGLLFYCPFLCLSLAGFGAWVRRAERRPEAFVCASIVVLSFTLSAGYYAWDGGFSTGPRHLVPMLPFMVLPIAYFMREGRWASHATVAAIVPSVAIMAACTAVLVQSPEGDPRWMNGLYSVVVPSLLRGEVAINPLDAFHTTWQHDAAYNLGTLFGLGARTSLLVPPLVWLAAYRRDLWSAA